MLLCCPESLCFAFLTKQLCDYICAYHWGWITTIKNILVQVVFIHITIKEKINPEIEQTHSDAADAQKNITLTSSHNAIIPSTMAEAAW